MVPPRSPLAPRFSSALPLSHSVIRPTTGSEVRPELGRVCVLDAGQIARGFDHRHLHAEADAEIRHVDETPPSNLAQRLAQIADRTIFSRSQRERSPVPPDIHH